MTTKAPVDNWQLDFNYHGNGIDCDLNLSGNAAALATGLKLATWMIQEKIEALLASGKAPAALYMDATILAAVMQGNVQPHIGEYLTINRLSRKAKGLSTVMTISWGD